MIIPNIYFSNIKGVDEDFIHIKIKTFDITNDGNHAIATAAYEDNLYYCKLIDGKWVLHRNDGPAGKQDEFIWFFYNGINVKICDMPIDDEEKLILALKHTLIREPDDDNCYAVYTL